MSWLSCVGCVAFMSCFSWLFWMACVSCMSFVSYMCSMSSIECFIIGQDSSNSKGAWPVCVIVFVQSMYVVSFFISVVN